jgi:hypothetical protein
MPSRRTFKLLASLPRRATSILIQLRTGHGALNCFLRKIKAVDSALCSVCRAPETVAHFLLHCKRYVDARRSLRRDVGKGVVSLRQLLNGQKVVLNTLRFIARTARLKYYLNVAHQNS